MTALSSITTDESVLSSEPIDFSRRFMPEELTPFYHVSGYSELTESQRLRYNQLNALYFNEQTMFFEKTLAQNVLGYFLRGSISEGLKEGLRQFLREEGEHSAMFRELNLKCSPTFYAHRDFHFIRVPRPLAKILDVVSKHPMQFPFLIWLMHLQEERAMFFGRAFLKAEDSLEPHFVAVQRRHLADEAGHVRWDEALLDWVWPRTARLLRGVNIRLFAWMIGEYFSTPKRSTTRVLAELVREFPDLQPRYDEFCRQLRSLGGNLEYRKALYCPETVPKTFKRFDAWPEFRSMMAAMPGYVAGANA